MRGRQPGVADEPGAAFVIGDTEDLEDVGAGVGGGGDEGHSLGLRALCVDPAFERAILVVGNHGRVSQNGCSILVAPAHGGHDHLISDSADSREVDLHDGGAFGPVLGLAYPGAADDVEAGKACGTVVAVHDLASEVGSAAFKLGTADGARAGVAIGGLGGEVGVLQCKAEDEANRVQFTSRLIKMLASMLDHV